MPKFFSQKKMIMEVKCMRRGLEIDLLHAAYSLPPLKHISTHEYKSIIFTMNRARKPSGS